MSITTLLRFLIGDRQSILEIAANRRVLWVGALFVLSAGFAREYDGEDLLHEPWHLVIPLGASLLSSFILFTITFGKILLVDPGRPSFLSAYRSFLTLFWMTAPLAWLYAIPYERFLSPADSVAANLWTLGLVALWRVVLMIRVISVLMGYRGVHAFFLVMLFADAVALLAIRLMPRPVFSFMGGVHHLTAAERILSDITCFVGGCGCLALPVWLIGALTAWGAGKPAWQLPFSPRIQHVAPGRSLWVLALASLAVWVFILPWTQAEQGLRYQVEKDLRNGRISDGLTLMTAHSPKDFPPHWDPPPRVGYGEDNPPLVDVLEVLVAQPAAPWVHTLFVEKFRQVLEDPFNLYRKRGEEARRIVGLLGQLPEGPTLAGEYRDDLERMVHSDPDVSKQDIERLQAILGEGRGKKANQKRE